MYKQKIIDTLNKSDDYKTLGFSCQCDDGNNSLLTKKYGKGFIQINRFVDDDGNFFYDDNIDRWYN